MKILVVGGGGREHAIIGKLAQSAKNPDLFCAPGNAGIAEQATCVDIAADDVAALVGFAQKEAIDLTFVGPEAPLAAGIVDEFKAVGLRIVGPNKAAAVLEGSKSFTKEVLEENSIPTAPYRKFTDTQIDEALAYVAAQESYPVVIKADGLAAGKGVIIAQNCPEAQAAVNNILADKAFGAAGSSLIIEGFLDGEEASFLAFTDGQTIRSMVSSQDHKRAYDGDKGPNTGGMGAYSPAPVMTKEMEEQVMRTVIKPLLVGLAARGIKYQGVLYAGIMVCDGKPFVLEFNVRFGDPETQAVLARLQTDLVTILEAIADERLSELELEWDARPAVCIVMAAEGYPGKYAKGREIAGISGDRSDDVVVFHAATRRQGDQVVTTGGRVLGVTALGADLRQAVDKAYKAVAEIKFSGAHFRRDIAYRAFNRGI